ncbi:SAM-dependent methyltransferase [Sorangium cellulosum]|uniref:SAM-dependent methyltransferase n=1 Tax=Sorangium cellulosum TaxID=56 RepID=A0A2L0EZ57_SORCE|nr:class I SAM-dependent methyltransferase [Sorangium cellulosum]AUX44519.1 SAM-dependent methyltransferase [Sorangium cellulosum]
MIEAAGPNADQIRYWNEVAGPKWVVLHDIISAQIRPLGLLAMDHAGLAAGERVLDIGCGIGETTREIGRRVGPGGSAVGVDISAPMLDSAREAARAAGAANVTFVNADAQTAALPGPFDVLYSRFGVMFFAEPQAAFTNLRSALRKGGRLAFVCWRSLQENPWLLVPATAAARHLPLPQPDPHAPGPFAFADAARVRDILSRAGFVRIHHEPIDRELSVAGGKSLDETVEFLLQMGPTASALREAQPEPELLDRVRAEVREAIAPHQGPEGVRMAGAVWIVTAAVD